MGILIQAAQLLLSLSILVVLHELGHFLPARFFGTRVEKFYLFFDYKFSLLKWKRGETEYGIGWIPLGGYVKISGMIDESLDKDQMDKPAESWEFRAKPAWQRLIIMVGGVTVNLILGFFIYAMILFFWGKNELPLTSATEGMHYDTLLLENGFKEGDKIQMVGDQTPYDTRDFSSLLFLDNHKTVTVEREGTPTVIDLPANLSEQLLEKGASALAIPRTRYMIGEIEPGSPVDKAGLKLGDYINGVNGKQYTYAMEIHHAIVAAAGKSITLDVTTKEGVQKSLTLVRNDAGIIGVLPAGPDQILKVVHHDYSFFQAIPAGVNFGLEVLGKYVKQFKLVFTKAGAKQIGGFATMGKLFNKHWDWHQFWEMTALISIILAFMNILPIPALDGGHIIFLLWEMIAGKPAPEKVMEYAQYAGMILLLGLMLFANGNDIFRLFTK
ncbi:MAG: RIP metalloprotease RseP [Bacteroidota bacterium]